MEQCAICGAETELHISGVPICVTCAEAKSQQVSEAIYYSYQPEPPEESY